MSNMIYIGGEFKGLCQINDLVSIGPIDFSEIKWNSIELNSINEINPYNPEELKVGNYCYFSEFSQFSISFKTVKILDSALNRVVLNEIEIERSFKVDGEEFFILKGRYFAQYPDKSKLENKALEPSVEPLKETSEDKNLQFDYINADTEEVFKEAKEQGIDSEKPTEGGCSNFLSELFSKRDSLSSSNKSDLSKSGNSSNRSKSKSKTFALAFFLGLIFFSFYFKLGVFLSSLLIGFGLIILLSRYFSWIGKALRVILGLAIGLILISALLGTLSNLTENEWWENDRVDEETTEEVEWEKERETEELEVEEDNGIISYFLHRHNWKQNSGEKRFGRFKVEKSDFSTSRNKRNRLAINYYNSSVFWNKVYGSLINQDKNKLQDIYELYDSVGKLYNLNRNEFADMVVSSVQWIPYVLVLEKSCEDSKYDGGFVTEYLMQGKPCLGGIKFGLQSPVEFMSNFQGDCDTRSVTCYMILEKFGYDVAVLISEKYGHAILGINLNVGGGDFIKHQGKRYYVWETTSVGYSAGVIPRDCSNLNYWKVAISSKI